MVTFAFNPLNWTIGVSFHEDGFTVALLCFGVVIDLHSPHWLGNG